MRHYKFEDWCHNAVNGIGFSPDREKVYRELYGHMEDRYDALRAQGVEPGDAEKQVYDAMGDAFAIGKQLAEIHRPFWAFFLRATRWVLAIILVLTVIPALQYLQEFCYEYPQHRYSYDIYDPSSYGGDTGRTLLMLEKPDISFKDGGYTYTVTDAVVWEDTYDSEERTFLYLRLKQFNPRPWALFPDWQNYPLYDLYAVDSRGTYYYSMNQREEPEDTSVCVTGGQTGPFTLEYAIWINRIQLEDNDWIEFIYDRDGRDHRIRIYLPGGDSNG